MTQFPPDQVYSVPSDADFPLAEARRVPVFEIPTFGIGVHVGIARHIRRVNVGNGRLSRGQIPIIFVQDLGDQTQILLSNVSGQRSFRTQAVNSEGYVIPIRSYTK